MPLAETDFPPLPAALQPGGKAPPVAAVTTTTEKTTAAAAPAMLTQAEFGRFYFTEQVKLSIMQTLVFIELVMTSDSLVIYSLCAGGIALLVFFTLLVYSTHKPEALAFLYPALLMITAALLSVVTVVKVFYVHEQTEFALTFLGITFTVDHIVLTSEAISQNVQFVLSNNNNGRNNNGRNDELSSTTKKIQDSSTVVESVRRFALEENKQHDTKLASKLADGVFFVIVLVAMGVALLVGLAHAAVTVPVYFLVRSWFVPKYVGRLVGRYGLGSYGAVNGAVRNGLQLWVSVLVVDVTFCVVAAVCSKVSGGLQTGGTPIEL